MAKLTGRGFTAAESDAFIKRASESHTVQWKADSRRLVSGGGSTLLQADVPIVGGTLSLDSSDPIRRRMTIEVGGEQAWLIPNNPDDPLVPFGQFLVLEMRIDLADGSWSKWVPMGEMHIVSHTFERPSMITTVEAMDWSGRVDEVVHLGRTSYKKQPSVRSAIYDMVTSAVPEKAWDKGQFQAGKGIEVGKYIVDAGTGRWAAAVELADNKGLETFFDSHGELMIRHAITRDNDDVIPSDGPDIGTRTAPVATIAEGTNMVAMTSTLTRQGGCNHVRINLEGTVTRRDKKQNTKNKKVETHEKDWTDHVDSTTNSGAAAYGSAFGKLPIVLDQNLHKLGVDGAKEKGHQQDRANALRHRRLGLIKYIDLDMVGGYQIEPDDKVKLKFGDVVEDHYVQSVSWDLSGRSATRIRTRQISVTDPGEGGGI